jgi:hypothetical protein
MLFLRHEFGVKKEEPHSKGKNREGTAQKCLRRMAAAPY